MDPAKPKPCGSVASDDVALSSEHAETAEAFFGLVRAAAAAAPPPVKEEEELQVWSIALVYGELAPATVARVLRIALDLCTAAGTQRRFVDLGSGEGVPCVVAAALFPEVTSVHGIELVPRLHRKAAAHVAAAHAVLAALARSDAPGADAERAAAGFASRDAAAAAAARMGVVGDSGEGGVAPCGEDGGSSSPPAGAAGGREGTAFASVGGASACSSLATPSPTAVVRLTCDDFMDGACASAWAASEVVLMCGTCFEVKELEAIYRRAEAMPRGALFITTTHTMPGRLFECVHTGTYAASWPGGTTVRIYRRAALPKWVAGVVGRR